MTSNIQTPSQQASSDFYKPSVLHGMFRPTISQQDINKKAIYLQGINFKNPELPQKQETIFSRLTTKRINSLIFSINADCQWVNCSQNVPANLEVNKRR